MTFSFKLVHKTKYVHLYCVYYLGEPIHTSLLSEGLRLPNMCSDRVLDMASENKLVHEKPFTNPSFKLRKFEDIARILSGAKLTNLGLLTGERSYYLTGVLAELEQVILASYWLK